MVQARPWGGGAQLSSWECFALTLPLFPHFLFIFCFLPPSLFPPHIPSSSRRAHGDGTAAGCPFSVHELTSNVAGEQGAERTLQRAFYRRPPKIKLGSTGKALPAPCLPSCLHPDCAEAMQHPGDTSPGPFGWRGHAQYGPGHTSPLGSGAGEGSMATLKPPHTSPCCPVTSPPAWVHILGELSGDRGVTQPPSSTRVLRSP